MKVVSIYYRVFPHNRVIFITLKNSYVDDISLSVVLLFKYGLLRLIYLVYLVLKFYSDKLKEILYSVPHDPSKFFFLFFNIYFY